MSDIKEILQNIGYQNLKDFGGWYRTRPIYRISDNDTVLAINKNTGYWRYRMHGIDFFIPNYGAVLVLDTSFQDLSVDKNK